MSDNVIDNLITLAAENQKIIKELATTLKKYAAFLEAQITQVKEQSNDEVNQNH